MQLRFFVQDFRSCLFLAPCVQTNFFQPAILRSPALPALSSPLLLSIFFLSLLLYSLSLVPFNIIHLHLPPFHLPFLFISLSLFLSFPLSPPHQLEPFFSFDVKMQTISRNGHYTQMKEIIRVFFSDEIMYI